MKANLFFIFSLILIISGCTDQCIEADDFGHARFSIPARYDAKDLESIADDIQVAPWIDTNYRLNGKPLTIVVQGWNYKIDNNNEGETSAWSSWLGNPKDGNALSETTSRLQTCKFIDGKMCTNTEEAQLQNPPCLFKNGVGLYALITSSTSNPNDLIETKMNPEGITFHLGAQAEDVMYEIDKKGNRRQVGGRIYRYKDEDKGKYVKGKLFLKILDRYYEDNSGQYKVVVKSGLEDQSINPIEYGTKVVKDFLFGNNENNDKGYGLVKKLYEGVVKHPTYYTSVYALILLYIVFTGIGFITGNINISNSELMTRIGKIAIVATLLTAEKSWDFFYNYLFVYFLDGIDLLLGIIKDSGATGPGSSGIMQLMLAPETLSKLASLLFVDWGGFIYIIMFMIALYFVVKVFFEASVIYLTALIAISMIITMAPIFICFLLFKVTRSLFENWLKQLMSYAFQPIILFTGLMYISTILSQEIYGSLGFKVCRYGVPKMEHSDGTPIYGKDYPGVTSILSWWFPEPKKGEDFSRTKAFIPIPVAHVPGPMEKVPSNNKKDFCLAYECSGERYMDLPFLDPDKDQRKIQAFWSGRFVQFDTLLLIVAAIYLLMKFNSLTISIGQFLTGTSRNFTEIGEIAEHGMDLGASLVKNSIIGSKIMRRASIRGTSVMGRASIRGMSMIGNNINQRKQLKTLNNQLRDHWMREALSSDADAKISEKLQQSMDMSEDFKSDAHDKYQDLLSDAVKSLNPKLKQAKVDKISKELLENDAGKVRDELSKIKYNKRYDKISEDAQKVIDDITELQNFKETQESSMKLHDYQKKYFDEKMKTLNAPSKRDEKIQHISDILRS